MVRRSKTPKIKSIEKKKRGKKKEEATAFILLLRVRVGGYIVNLLDFYSYRLIGKLTAFLQLQEFSQRNLPAFIAFAARLSFLG
jgi:hypothetical protein